MLRPKSNDGTVREAIWRRYEGDDWAAFDKLPAAIRGRLREQAYDARSVNALMLWRHYRLIHPTPERAERALLRYFDHCERLERQAFSADFSRRYGADLPHEAARVPVPAVCPGCTVAPAGLGVTAPPAPAEARVAGCSRSQSCRTERVDRVR